MLMLMLFFLKTLESTCEIICTVSIPDIIVISKHGRIRGDGAKELKRKKTLCELGKISRWMA
jgi:hypothetical protein